MKTLIVTLIISLMFTSCSGQDCEEPSNVWFKVSNASETYGEMLQLDMSKGYADTDGIYVYLFVKDGKGEGVMISFPIGYWEIEESKKDPFLEEMEKEFKDLENYLKNTKGNGIEIKKQ